MTSTAAGRPAGNLPIAVTSFIGRRREIAEVRKRLSESRLVTLTGVGGVGKTRLAIEAAAAARRAFEGGVAMVDLAAVEEGSQVPQAVVNALGLVERSTKPPLDKLVDHLARDQVLIVLDNCEHLLDACAAFVDGLLRRTPGVRVLATSRRILGIDGEHLFAVPPLSIPDPQRTSSAEALDQYESVRLLVDRARALQPTFAITEDNRVAAARLCAQLDGIPLAIELAVTRLRSLSLDQLVERLEERFALLTGGSPAAQPRQQTLRALIDWSYSLCSPQERLLWARLSVFVGSFDLEAAEGICDGDGLDRSAILDLLDRLVAQSIVVTEPRAGMIRFRLLETIRQYGRERLTELDGADGSEGRVAQLRLRHRDFYLRRSERSAAVWSGPGQAAGLAQLRADHGNLRAALEVSVADQGSPRAALDLMVALRHHWYVDGFLAEGRGWLDRALAVPGEVPDARLRGLWVAAWVCLLQGDWDVAYQRLDECDALAAERGDRTATAWSRSLRGTGELFRGHLAEAVALFDEALEIFRAEDTTEGVLWAMFQLAISLSHSGDSERATAVCRESLAISESLGEQLCRSYTMWVLGFDTWRHGDPGEADRVTRDALSIQRDFHDPVGVALMIELLAWIAASRGDVVPAAGLLGAAGSVWEDIGTAILAFGPPLAEHHDACVARVIQAVGEAGLRDSLQAGRQPTVEQAIAYALRRPAPSPAASGGSADQETPQLTRREGEIAALVARGMSNRAIAAALVISPRTVDGHVERILAKLGFSSRAQVAAWVAGERDARVAGRR